MRKLIGAATLGLVGLVSLGLLGVTQVSAQADDPALKREDDRVELVLVADDDDDDTNDRSRDRTNSRTGSSRSTIDHTNSRFTAVSRDRDLSRSDKTRDWTRDGGDRTRDRTAGTTNDRSRNDTRR